MENFFIVFITAFILLEEIELMDSEDDEGVPVVQVGHRSIPITDINDEIIAQMTPSEKELYIQIYQDYYSHILD